MLEELKNANEQRNQQKKSSLGICHYLSILFNMKNKL